MWTAAWLLIGCVLFKACSIITYTYRLKAESKKKSYSYLFWYKLTTCHQWKNSGQDIGGCQLKIVDLYVALCYRNYVLYISHVIWAPRLKVVAQCYLQWLINDFRHDLYNTYECLKTINIKIQIFILKPSFTPPTLVHSQIHINQTANSFI